MFFNRLKKTDFLKWKSRGEHKIESTEIKTKIKILKELTILRRGKSCILITNSLAKNNHERWKKDVLNVWRHQWRHQKATKTISSWGAKLPKKRGADRTEHTGDWFFPRRCWWFGPSFLNTKWLTGAWRGSIRSGRVGQRGQSMTGRKEKQRGLPKMRQLFALEPCANS